MEISVTSDGGWTLCHDCLDAGCTPWPGDSQVGGVQYSSTEHECQVDHGFDETPVFTVKDWRGYPNFVCQDLTPHTDHLWSSKYGTVHCMGGQR